jgi:hypothetical protein
MDACFANVSAFKDCADSVQSIFVAIAVLIGGIWTLFTYTILGTRVRAERDLFEQAVVNVAIKVEQVWIPGDANLYLAAVATLTNTGNRNVYIDFNSPHADSDEPSPFKISMVEFDFPGWGSPGLSWTRDISGTYNSTLRLRRGSSQEIPLFSRVPNVGLYLVEFAAALTTKEAIVDDGIGAPGPETRTDGEEPEDAAAAGSINWTGSAYITIVQKQPSASALESRPIYFWQTGQ